MLTQTQCHVQQGPPTSRTASLASLRSGSEEGSGRVAGLSFHWGLTLPTRAHVEQTPTAPATDGEELRTETSRH